ncbi:hypothetical protein V1523DRAFT_142986 [Lipomyces doorenjongii]
MAHAIFPDIPQDVELWRERLFNATDGLTLTAEQFNVYFPFVSNVYRHKKTGPVNQNNVKSEYYEYRFFGEPSHDKNVRERRRTEALEANPNLSTRHTARRNSGQCSFKLVLRVTCDIDGSPLLYPFEPKGQNHNHDLDRSDQLKRSRAPHRLGAIALSSIGNYQVSIRDTVAPGTTSTKDHWRKLRSQSRSDQSSAEVLVGKPR